MSTAIDISWSFRQSPWGKLQFIAYRKFYITSQTHFVCLFLFPLLMQHSRHSSSVNTTLALNISTNHVASRWTTSEIAWPADRVSRSSCRTHNRHRKNGKSTKANYVVRRVKTNGCGCRHGWRQRFQLAPISTRSRSNCVNSSWPPYARRPNVQTLANVGAAASTEPRRLP